MNEILNIKNFSTSFPLFSFRNTGIKEAIGTFKNGKLHGPAKIVFKDNSKIISNFLTGIPFGPRRTWNFNNTLTNINYFDENQNAHYRCWELLPRYLVWRHCSIMKINEKDMFDVIIPLDSDEDILIGRVDSSTGLADELYSADIKVLIIYFLDSRF